VLVDSPRSYQRKYRSRLLYTVTSVGDKKRKYNQLGKEMIPVTSGVYPIVKNVMETHALERGIPAVYNLTWESLHRLTRLEQVRGSSLPEVTFSNDKLIYIVDVSFHISDYPTFRLRVDGFGDFDLETWRQGNAREYRIRDGQNVNPDKKVLGLNPSGNDKQNLVYLYAHVLVHRLGFDKNILGLILN
jgi:hypothetical protein